MIERFAGEEDGLEVEEQRDGDDAWKGRMGSKNDEHGNGRMDSKIDEHGRRQTVLATFMSATGTCLHCLLHGGTGLGRASRFQKFVDSPFAILRLLCVRKGQP